MTEMKDHRRWLLNRLQAIKAHHTDIAGDIDLAGAIDQSLEEYAADEPDAYEEFVRECPAATLRKWNNEDNQAKRSSARRRYGDDVNRTLRGEEVDAPTLDGSPNPEILELEFFATDADGRRVSKQLGHMNGEQRRELESRYEREERQKRGYRRFFSDLNRAADEERDRKRMPDSATLYEIFAV